MKKEALWTALYDVVAAQGGIGPPEHLNDILVLRNRAWILQNILSGLDFRFVWNSPKTNRNTGSLPQKNLQVRKIGPARKHLGKSVGHLEPDVAEAFPDAASVNEALRCLIRVTQENKTAPSRRDSDI